MELLKEVLLKEADGSKQGDKVLYVNNLPKDLLYHLESKLMIDSTSPMQNLIPAYVIEQGVKKFTGEQAEVLNAGIEKSQTRDGAYVFFTQYNEARYALKKIQDHIRSVVPVTERIPAFVPYSSQPGTMTAGPIPLSDIPHVVLPGGDSPQGNLPPQTDDVSKHSMKRPYTPEELARKRAVAAKARDARNKKRLLAQQNQDPQV